MFVLTFYWIIVICRKNLKLYCQLKWNNTRPKRTFQGKNMYRKIAIYWTQEVYKEERK